LAYISLYRKWRPQTFEEVVGQEHVTRTLSNAIKQDRISHAYLFSGPRGTGKTTVAKTLAKAVNCEKGPTPAPCNQCDNCLEITNGSSVDVLEIDAASNRGIDEIRDLREKVHFAPTRARIKVYIIDEVHMLTPEAFNALLKTLEEPPQHVIFVLATTELHKVIPTIISRCQQFDFRRISIADIKERLQEIAEAEKIQVDEASIYLIAKSGQGSLRDAIGTLDQLSSFTGGKIGLDDVTSLLGAVDLELLFEMADNILAKDASACLEFVQTLTESGRDLKQFAKELLEYFHSLLVIKNVDRPEQIIDSTAENLYRMQKQAAQIGVSSLIRITDVMAQALADMRWNPDPKLHLEIALVKLARPEEDISVEGLIARVEELERRLGQLDVRAPVSDAQGLKCDVQAPRSDVGGEKTAGGEKPEPRPRTQESRTRSPRPEVQGSKPDVQSPRAEAETAKPKTQGRTADVESPKSTGSEKQDLPLVSRGSKNQEHDTGHKEQAASGKKSKTDGQEASNAQDRTPESQTKIDMAKVKRLWPIVLDHVKKKKISAHALLLECQPVKVENQEVTIVFNDGASFHCREIKKSQNMGLLKSAFKEITGESILVRCLLNGEAGEEATVEIVAEESESKEEVVEILSTPNIVKLVQDSFEAEVVDEANLD
jgi:DNA polymerase-3 subunit gamma/tau